ncbi:hypothetical protein KY343_06650 [Candidatus Woesearchaeota archaeon]|nr:hypothetical protein [Candidatus Woesearchaeota archaeon]
MVNKILIGILIGIMVISCAFAYSITEPVEIIDFEEISSDFIIGEAEGYTAEIQIGEGIKIG